MKTTFDALIKFSVLVFIWKQILMHLLNFPPFFNMETTFVALVKLFAIFFLNMETTFDAVVNFSTIF